MRKLIFAVVSFILIFTFSASAVEISYIENSEFEDRVGSCTFTKGIALVHRLGETAVVNNYGKIVIDYSARAKGIASNGLIALLGENNKIGFFNSEGKQVTDYIYDAFVDVHEKTEAVNVGFITSLFRRGGDGMSDLIPVSKDGKFGYINSYGTVVIPFRYEYAYGFSGGIAMVCADGKLSDYGTYTEGKYGFIREDGTEILPPDSYWVAWEFDNSLGYATASNGGSDTVYVDKDGNVAKPDSLGRLDIDVPYIITNPAEGYYGVNDRYGNTIIPMEYGFITVRGDRFVVGNTLRNAQNEVMYSAPENGKIYFELGKTNFPLVSVYPDGVFGGTSLVGCIDWDGNVIVEPVYDYVSDIGDGLICARKGGMNYGVYYLFDYTGRLIAEMNDKPVTAYDGFLVVNNIETYISRVAVNPLKRPRVYLNDSEVCFTDAYPYFESQRTMIPLRSVFEQAGAEVGWDAETGTVSVKRGSVEVSMKIGDRQIKIGDEIYETDVAPVALNNRTYIPLRVFSEGIGMNVDWDGENYKVYLAD